MTFSSLCESACLQEERQANEGIMEALEREKQAAMAAQQRALAEHLAELEAERQRQSDLAARLNQTQVLMCSQKDLCSNCSLVNRGCMRAPDIQWSFSLRAACLRAWPGVLVHQTEGSTTDNPSSQTAMRRSDSQMCTFPQ